MAKTSYGRTKSGKEITEAVIEEIVADAESGYDLDKLLERRGLKRDPDS